MSAAVWKTVSIPSTAAATKVSVADVALQHLQPGLGGQRRGRTVEGPHLVAVVEQGGHQVGADEPRAAGDKDPAQLGGQRCVRNLSHADEDD